MNLQSSSLEIKISLLCTKRKQGQRKAGENKRGREKTNLSKPEMLKKQILHLSVTINTKQVVKTNT